MQIRNVAIIAHVDHGKTTLIDGMLKQTHLFRDNQAEMAQTTILDSNELEREKGITILAKNTAVFYQDAKINIIDTPGHADFGGEVERVINMADGALLVVDAAEGPLPQTRFVLEQALKHGLKIIVVINKVDKKLADPAWALNQVEELFLELAATEEQLIFPIAYTAGIAGKAWLELPADFDPDTFTQTEFYQQTKDLQQLFDLILREIPAPQADPNQPFMMQVANLDFDNFMGIYAIGKVVQGCVKPASRLNLWQADQLLGTCQVGKVFTSKGLDRIEVKEATSGDIIALTGINQIKIGQTLAAPAITHGLPMIAISPPTLKVQIAANTSPFAGREGEFCTERQLQDRLMQEKKTNLGLKIELNPQGKGFVVAGRGELHLAVLLETMRREGYEMEVSRPQVIFQHLDGVEQEPLEELSIDIEQEYLGVISEELGRRRALLKSSVTDSKGVAHVVYEITSRSLLGFRSQILTKTRGCGLFNSRFIGYCPLQNLGNNKIRNGVLIATESGQSTAYALEGVQQRGLPFVRPGVSIYEGMIIGLAKTEQDLEMNVCKAKQLTNFRSNADIATHIDTPKELTLQESLTFIEDDELLEITPQSLRLRKRYLHKKDRAKKAN